LLGGLIEKKKKCRGRRGKSVCNYKKKKSGFKGSKRRDCQGDDSGNVSGGEKKGVLKKENGIKLKKTKGKR